MSCLFDSRACSPLLCSWVCHRSLSLAQLRLPESAVFFASVHFQVELFGSLFRLIDSGHPVFAYGVTNDHHTVTGESPMSVRDWCVQHADQFK